MAAPAALEGLRAVELSRAVAAAYCGRQFALWGAEVVALEPASGSPLRSMAPLGGEPRRHGSLLWQYVAADKRAVAVESAAPDRESFLELLAGADVLIVDCQNRQLASWELSLASIHEDLRHLVIVSVTPFGLEGPYSQLESSELVVQALSGYAHFNGDPGRPPLKAPGHILAYTSGVSAFVGGLAALVGATTSGHGRIVDVAEHDTITAMLPLLRCEYTGLHPQRLGGPNTGVRAFPCRDGFVTFIPPEPEQLTEYGAVLDVDAHEWPNVDGLEPTERRFRLVPFLLERTPVKTVDEIFYGLLDRGIVCGKVAAPEELLEDPHLRERRFFHSLAHPELGTLDVSAAAAHLSRTPARPPGLAPAEPERIRVADLGWDRRHRPLETGEPPSTPPLASVKVVDATQAWVGPFAAMLLADLGADMIKIESHLRPDVWRRWSANPVAVTHVRADQVNASPNYNSANRNKRSLCLNLKTDEGKGIFRQLVADSDIVMENFTPRVMDRFDLGYAALARINPRLVMTSFSGYGKTGPLADYKANGTSIEAMAGWDHLHRYPGEAPMVMGFYQADAITGYQMAATTLVALLHQRRTGRGQAVESSMYEAAVGYIGEVLLEAQLGDVTTPVGNRDADMAPNGVYPCRDEDRWIAISVPDDAVWASLVTVVDDARLNDSRLVGLAGRRAAEDRIDTLLADWTRARSAYGAMARLQEAHVPAGVVRTTRELFACAHLAARDWFRPIVHEEVGRHRYNGQPYRIVGVERGADLPPPRLGEHGRDLLRERLGLDEGEIEALFERGITGQVVASSKDAATHARS